MAESPRIDELRRRVARDPASILFAQLAEEHRRAGNLDDAVRICRTGLERYPAYVAARVTLGRALLDLGRVDDARRELEAAVHDAPDNLAALRSLSELQRRTSDVSAAPRELEPRALREPERVPLAELEGLVVREVEPRTPRELEPAAVRQHEPRAPRESEPRALRELERWLDVIRADRARRSARRDTPSSTSGIQA